MDLDRFIANRELLERLSREYELLKASGAEVDYSAWVRQRLREAAAELAAQTIGEENVLDNPRSGSLGELAGAEATSASEQIVHAGEVAGGSQTNQQSEQLAFTRRQGIAPPAPAPRPALEGGVSSVQPETVWYLRGEGPGPASEALATAIYGPSAPGVRSSGPALPRGAKVSRQSKKVVIISPRKSPLQAQPRTSPNQQTAQPPPVSKLYTRVETGLFSARPDAYVHAQARARRTPLAATRPDWVNAASLQAALRGASSAVPHLQAAAERERRLALSTALARQTLAAGLGADDARAVALYGTAQASASAQAAQYDHVLQVAQQLAQQNEQLALAVQLNSAQLAQQQAVLESALQQQRPGGGAATGQTALVSAPAGPAAASGEPPGAAGPGTRVEVESGPPPWFVRLAHGPAAPGGAGGGGLSSKLGHRSRLRSSSNSSKSPKKAAARAHSPPSPHTVIAATAPRTMSAKASLPAAVAATVKERERTSRKDALKALLKEVLGSAGLAGGKEGRRRLASSMAEAEKLVTAIHALAQIKAGKDGMPEGETARGGRAVAVAETQTSGRGSASGAGASKAVLAVPAGEQLPETRQGVAWGPSHDHAQASLGAGMAAKSSVQSSRAMSQQGSGPESEPVGTSGSESLKGGAEPVSVAPPANVPSSSAKYSGSSEDNDAVPPKSVSHMRLLHQASAKTRSTALSIGSDQVTDVPGPSSHDSSSSEETSHTAPQSAAASAARSQAGNRAQVAEELSGAHARAGAADQTRSQAPASGETARGAPPGLLVESLEDQVQQIVERDAAAAAEMGRLQKLDALEQRLNSMVDKVESKLTRVLQPLHLNAQQLQQAGLQGHATWGLRSGLEAQAPHGPAAPTATAGGDPSIAVVAAAVAAAAAAAPGAVSDATRNPSAGAAPHVEVVSPRSAGLSVLELQRMLIQLNRMESKEQEVRRKWFFDAKGPRQRGQGGQHIVVRDGVLGTLDPADPDPPPPMSPPHAVADRTASPDATISRAAFWTFTQPPTESALATVAADSTRTALSGPGRAGAELSSMQAQDGSAAVDRALADPISDAILESVLRGRRRFLRAQKLADGDLLEAAEPSINPVQIMEDLTDALLDELLYEQAKELTGLCDTLGERMVKDECDVSEDES